MSGVTSHPNDRHTFITLSTWQDTMRLSLSPLRPLIWLAVAAALVVAAVDGGSVVLARIKVPDDVKRAGLAAASEVEGEPVNQRAATIAYDTASRYARPLGIEIKAKTFTLYPDGRVELTGVRIAPTLVLDRIEPLRHYAKIKATETVSASPWS